MPAKRRSGGGTRNPPAPPTEGGTAWDWLYSVDPDYAMRLSLHAQQKLQDVPFKTDPTLGGSAWGALSGRDLEGTAYYQPGTAVEGEHIFAGAEKRNNPDALKHETLHSLEWLSDYGPKDWWDKLTPAMQRKISEWYGTSGPMVDMAAESFVGISQLSDFTPWKIPPEYQGFYSNIYPSFKPPEDLPAPPGFYQRLGDVPKAGSRSQRATTVAQRAGTGIGESWGVSLPPVRLAPGIKTKRRSPSKVGRKSVR